MKVLITGAAGGLGRVFVNECVKRGYDVCATDINHSGLLNIRKGVLSRFKKEILTYKCDITDDGSISELEDYLEKNGFEIEMLINVAGVDFEGGFLQRSFSEIKDIVSLNILGTLRITHRLLAKKDSSKRFYLINISSLAAEQPIPLKATYAASKRFLLDFSQALSTELKSKNVNVLAVCPAGLVTNETVIKAIEGQGFFGTLTTCRMEVIVNKTIKYALKGKTKYIPGFFNKFTSLLNHFLPTGVTTKILYKRWAKAQSQWLPENLRRV
jgi:short-subunit dehydrogenase